MDWRDGKWDNATEGGSAKRRGVQTTVGAPVATSSIENDPNDGVNRELVPGSQTTASVGHSCEECSGPLKGRQQRFCSDTCRMRAQRAKRQYAERVLLDQIDSDFERLRRTLDELLTTTLRRRHE